MVWFTLSPQYVERFEIWLTEALIMVLMQTENLKSKDLEDDH